MIRLPRFLALPVLALVIAGCGSAASTGPTASPTPAATSAPSTGSPVISGGPVAAVVNGEKVPMSLFRMLFTLAMRPQNGQPAPEAQQAANGVLTQMIELTVARQYAAKHGITVTQSEVDAVIKRDEKVNGGLAGLKKALKARLGITLDQYRTLSQANLLMQKTAAKISPIKPQTEHVAHVKHILLGVKPNGPYTDAKAHALALQLLADIRSGADFATLAKKYSDDPGSKARGGDLGTVQRGQTVAPFDHAAFTWPLNQPGIVKSQFGYHIVDVLGRWTAPTPPQQLQQQQQQRFSAWLAAQVKHAKVKMLARVAS